MDSNEPFSELVEEVSSDIKDIMENGKALEVKVEDPHDIIKDIMAQSEKYTEVLPEEPEPEPEVNTEIVFDDFDILPEMEHKEEPKKEFSEEVKEVASDISAFHNEIKIEAIPKIIDDFEETSPLDKIEVESCSIVENDKIKWSLKSPSAMFEPFYKQKKVVLDSCLAGGQIEYSLWTKELEEASVDVVTEVFDQQVIIKQMEDVQQFRNRVKYIGVRVNNQYFLFDRFTPLLRGYLARIQYMKPVLKQEGVVLEHMGDVEMYIERLRSLHKSVADTEKNLAAAYEMLSRKVTICMELPPVERFSKADRKERPQFNYEEKSFEDFEDFDNLPSDATAGPDVKVSGPTGWDSL